MVDGSFDLRRWCRITFKSLGFQLLGKLCLASASLLVVSLMGGTNPATTASVLVDDPLALSTAPVALNSGEIEELTSPTQLVVANADGTLTAELSAIPVRVPNPSGGWAPVDTSLVAQPDGSWAPSAALAQVALSGGGSQVLAQVESGGDGVIMGWQASLPAPRIEGDTATYPEVLPGVDLIARAGVTGFSTYIVVKDASAAENPDLLNLAFDVTGTGVAVQDPGDGTLVGRDTAGEVVFQTAPARMWDSRGLAEAAEGDVQELIDQPVSSREAAVDVSLAGGDLVVSPDAGLLENANADFPIVIDPTWSTKSVDESAWAMVWSNGMNFYNASGETARVGYDGWSTQPKKSRTFYRFEIPSVLDGATINSATFQHSMVHSPNHACKVAAYGPAVQVFRTNNFSSTPSWPGPALGAQQGSGDTYGSGHEDWGCGAVKREWNVKNALTGAMSDGSANVVLGMVSANETNRDGWRKYENSAAYPTLTVEFSRPPAVSGRPTIVEATNPSPSSAEVLFTADNTPTVRATVDDPDGGLLDVCFVVETQAGAQVRNIGCVGAIATSGSGGVVVGKTVGTPIADSPIGADYFLKVTVTDDTGRTAAGARRQFVIDTRVPVLDPIVLSAPPVTDGGWVQYGAPGSAVLDGDTATATYRYSVNATTSPTCSLGTEVGTTVPGEPRTISITATQGSANYLRVVACSRSGRSSALGQATFEASEYRRMHAWTWDGTDPSPPGVDIAPNTTAATALSDLGVPVPLRGSGVYWDQVAPAGSDKAISLSGVPAQGQHAATAVPVLNSASYTVAAWVWIDPNWTPGSVVVASNSGSVSDSMRLSASGAGWAMTIRSAESGAAVSTQDLSFVSSNCGPGEWCYVAGTWDAANSTAILRVIRRGSTQVTKIAWPASFVPFQPNSGAFRVGAGLTAGVVGGFFPGLIDRVTVWAGPIDDARLAQAAAQSAL
jgi:Concanavalin A-like lectin/glucanases superfamily